VSGRGYPAAVLLRTARRASATTVLAVALLVAPVAACARPGQLGQPEAPLPAAPVAAAAPAPAPTVAPAPPTGPVEVGRGVVDEKLNLRTTGPVEYSVRTLVLAPGEDTGWQRLPGTELTIVKSGEVALQRSDACAADRVAPGSTVVVPENRPHVLRNTGARPAELVVTRLLPPGAAARTEVPPAC
jgi:quercetin dioxygenase-like cupin family protein